MPSDVTIALHIHGNEFRHMVNHVHRFGMYVLEQMPRIHATTGCTVSFSDAGLQTTFSHVLFIFLRVNKRIIVFMHFFRYARVDRSIQ